jgi:hypothetical protein
MTAITRQNLIRLEDSIPETKLVAIVRQEPAEITGAKKLEFRQSFDDLDYLVFATLSLPSGDRIGLIRHQNSPSPGTEICVSYDRRSGATILQEALGEMNLTVDDLTWIHPEYEQQVKTSGERVNSNSDEKTM